MPILKDPYKDKMANGDAGGRSGALILEREGQGTNPFEEDLEENEQDSFLGNGRYRRRATLEKLVGLSPFRLGKWGGEKKSPSGEKGSDRKSFLGRMMIPLCSLDCGLAEKENSGADSAKRGPFLKIGLGARVRRASLVEKLNQVEAAEPGPGPGPQEPEGKAKEPLSVLEILNLIQKRDLLVADKHIIELEEECGQGGQRSPGSGALCKDGSRKAKDVALLYEALQQELWAVLAEALAAGGGAARGGAGAGGRSGPRPRAMRQRWAEAVGALVEQRLSRSTEGRGGPLATQLDRLAKCMVEDLCTVRFRLLHTYPEEYGAFGVYLCSYHRGLARRLAEAVQRCLPRLASPRREVLGWAEIASLVKAQALGPLLSPETQLSLEEDCIAAVKVMAEAGATGTALRASLPGGSLAASRLPTWQVLKAHADRAPQITEDFGRRMAHCCLTCLADFLQSFQRKVERFHEAQAEGGLSGDGYMGRTISLVNCYLSSRDYVQHLAGFGHPESEAARSQAECSLDRVTRLCNHVLAEHLFQNLKPYFHKLMKRKWLSNSEAFPTIMALLAEHAQKMKKMKQEPHLMLVTAVHRQVLIEYVRPLMRVRIICTSAKMRSKVAGRLRSEAKQLQEFFAQLGSTSSWLDSAVPHLASIIGLEDMPAVQVEVGFLAQEFPDVQKNHVAAILNVRGLQNQAQRQDILAVLDVQPAAREAALCQDRAFFAEIPTSEVFCIRVQVHRLSQAGLSCISWLQQRPRRRRRQRPAGGEWQG
uniref:Exocyst complex component 3 like 2 n=1 Tax=Varanus komodoensis TaxID=61221 RepID=A0A8D2KXF2_VARKO